MDNYDIKKLIDENCSKIMRNYIDTTQKLVQAFTDKLFLFDEQRKLDIKQIRLLTDKVEKLELQQTNASVYFTIDEFVKLNNIDVNKKDLKEIDKIAIKISKEKEVNVGFITINSEKFNTYSINVLNQVFVYYYENQTKVPK
jgi:hypothetical protein